MVNDVLNEAIKKLEDSVLADVIEYRLEDFLDLCDKEERKEVETRSNDIQKALTILETLDSWQCEPIEDMFYMLGKYHMLQELRALLPQDKHSKLIAELS